MQHTITPNIDFYLDAINLKLPNKFMMIFDPPLIQIVIINYLIW